MLAAGDNYNNQNYIMQRRFIALFLIMPLLAGLVGCGGQGGLSGQLVILSQNMTVHEFSGGGPESVAVVYGRAQNMSRDVMNSATISVSFYDKDRKLLATGSTDTQNLQPGQTWDFSVQTKGPDAWKTISYHISTNAK
jgi:hypothetical protein